MGWRNAAQHCAAAGSGSRPPGWRPDNSAPGAERAAAGRGTKGLGAGAYCLAASRLFSLFLPCARPCVRLLSAFFSALSVFFTSAFTSGWRQPGGRVLQQRPGPARRRVWLPALAASAAKPRPADTANTPAIRDWVRVLAFMAAIFTGLHFRVWGFPSLWVSLPCLAADELKITAALNAVWVRRSECNRFGRIRKRTWVFRGHGNPLDGRHWDWMVSLGVHGGYLHLSSVPVWGDPPVPLYVGADRGWHPAPRRLTGQVLAVVHFRQSGVHGVPAASVSLDGV